MIYSGLASGNLLTNAAPGPSACTGNCATVCVNYFNACVATCNGGICQKDSLDWILIKFRLLLQLYEMHEILHSRNPCKTIFQFYQSFILAMLLAHSDLYGLLKSECVVVLTDRIWRYATLWIKIVVCLIYYLFILFHIT